MPRIWTEQDRQRQADVIRRDQIWRASTGPKTQEGKDKSKMNAFKHGTRRKEMDDLLKSFKHLDALVRELGV